MKNLQLLFSLLAVIGVLLSSCTKEANTSVSSDAVIRASSANGCGYIIEISSNNQTYAPKNLTSEFSPADTLNVRVTYKLLKTVRNCSTVGGGYQEVEVISISKR